MKEILWKILCRCMLAIPSNVRKSLVNMLCHAAVMGDRKKALLELYSDIDAAEHAIDTAAIDLEGGIHPKHRLMKYHDYFVSKIRSGSNVLDVGCGYGAVSNTVAAAGCSVTGIDIEPENIVKAQALYKNNNIKFIAADVLKWEPNESYDVVIMSNVLEHIQDRIELLKRIRTEYKPGKILIRVPMITRDWKVLHRKELGITWYSDPTHCIEYTDESFEKEITSAGWSLKDKKLIFGEIWAELV